MSSYQPPDQNAVYAILAQSLEAKLIFDRCGLFLIGHFIKHDIYI